MPLIPALIAMARAHSNERERLAGGLGRGGRSAQIKFPELSLEENDEISNTLRFLGEEDDYMPPGWDDMSIPKLKMPKMNGQQ